MQSIRKCVRFVSSNTFSVNNSNCLPAILRSVFLIPSNNIHESSVLNKFLDYNKVIFPPQKPDEERRPGVSFFYYNKLLHFFFYSLQTYK